MSPRALIRWWREYADNDPVVLAHARALMTSRPEGACEYLDADLHDPAGILATLMAALAPGSFVAVSHLTGDLAPAAVASGVAAYNEAVPGRLTARPHAQVTALLGGLSLVPPGVVPVSEWRPESGIVRQPATNPNQ